MTSQLVLALQETHDPYRQEIMRDRASKIVQNLRDQTGIIGVVLSGSTARGPVGAASDLDLHVIISDKFTGSLPEWTFHKGGIIENLHIVCEDELLRGWRARNKLASLATWFHETKLGDELHQFMPLWWSSITQWRERLPVLVAYRQSPDVAQQVARCYLESACAHIRQAYTACHEGASLDCHHRLRLAFQAALMAVLIARGWIIRGSKKRIEIAQAFLPDPLIKSLLDVGLDVVGLNEMTPNQATTVCKTRLQYRAILLNELHRLKLLFMDDKHIANKLEAILKNQATHNAMAYDYYLPLINQGIIFGPINHVRCLSGLPQIPHLLVSCLCGERPWPIREFVQSDIISPNVRHTWLKIMALSSSRKQCDRLLLDLSATIDNLKL